MRKELKDTKILPNYNILSDKKWEEKPILLYSYRLLQLQQSFTRYIIMSKNSQTDFTEL